jgi:Fe-S-cluster containining protein
MSAYCLNIHARYQCQHAGACCTAGWTIPIETTSAHALRRRGLLKNETHTADEDGGTIALRKTPDGACVFYDTQHDGLCAIHRDAGPLLMPSACRNFPRVAVRDPRGIFITLSHFCPTVAGLLLSADSIAIVEAPPSLSLDGGVEGLDATGVMPPLLRPGMLMDWEGYDRWEREGIAVLSERGYSARVALRIIASATREIQRWSPGEATLASRVTQTFEQTRSALVVDRASEPEPLERPRKAFLASHLFASWAAYQRDLGAVVAQLEHALSLVATTVTDEQSFIAAVRDADWRLRHQGEHVRSRSLSPLRHH